MLFFHPHDLWQTLWLYAVIVMAAVVVCGVVLAIQKRNERGEQRKNQQNQRDDGRKPFVEN